MFSSREDILEILYFHQQEVKEKNLEPQDQSIDYHSVGYDNFARMK